jgi:hypothetical protein
VGVRKEFHGVIDRATVRWFRGVSGAGWAVTIFWLRLFWQQVSWP